MNKKIAISCEMEERWFPYFLKMLQSAEQNGNIGHSCMVGIYADGDGDFRPKFNIDGVSVLEMLEETKNIEPINTNNHFWFNDGFFFDAG